MSTTVSMQRIDTRKAEQLLDSILDGSFQKNASKRIPELLEELKQYPYASDEERYMPMYQTPEVQEPLRERLKKRSAILKELRSYPSLLRSIASLAKAAHASKEKAMKEWTRDLVDTLVGVCSKSFFQSAGDLMIYTDLLFKYKGIPEESTRDLETIPFSTWETAFSSLTKDILENIKTELDAEKNPNINFDEFVEMITSIRKLQKGANTAEERFSVMVEDEGDRSYEESLEKKVLTYLSEHTLEVATLDEETAHAIIVCDI